MAATQTLAHASAISQIPKHGVLTLYGFGIRVTMQSGHLCVEDGIGPNRRAFRLPRVEHRLRRLVVIGSDGFVSLAALRWLADQNASFVMLERDGHVLATTGPVRPSDVRLRRAQALAEQSGAALRISRELISRKLAGQERVARDKLLDPMTAEAIAKLGTEVECAETLDAIRWLESKGASLYWSIWRNLPVSFPKNDLRRVPQHWRKFDTRKSPLSGSQRLAADPVNAILNYLYAVLESEARLAAAALGLDPGLGFIHMDAAARDSFACDLMEPVRPEVDAWVLDWITREPLKREWFFEERNGNCRLMASLASRLAETAPMWARAVAPLAEWVARQLWSRQRASSTVGPPTRLTQSRKRRAKGFAADPTPEPAKHPRGVCRTCGKDIPPRRLYCPACAVDAATQQIKNVTPAARIAGHAPVARAKQRDTSREQRRKQAIWLPASQPAWLTEQFYTERIQPALSSVSISRIASTLGVSRCHATLVRSGKRRPHPRHWQPLINLAGLRDHSDPNAAWYLLPETVSSQP